jgi:hypothetical protein
MLSWQDIKCFWGFHNWGEEIEGIYAWGTMSCKDRKCQNCGAWTSTGPSITSQEDKYLTIQGIRVMLGYVTVLFIIMFLRG